MRLINRRWAARALSAAVLLGGTMGGLSALSSGPAGAHNENPGGNPTSPALSYEADCNTTLSPQVAPFISSTVLTTTAQTLKPDGTTFGVAGAVSVTVIGPIVAGFAAQLPGGLTTIGLTVKETLGSTNGTATGTAAFDHTFAKVAAHAGKVTHVHYTTGSKTLHGNFSGAATGDYVSGAGLTAQSMITAINGTTSATISIAASATEATQTIGFGPTETFTTATYASSATAFTTHGVTGGTADIGIVSMAQFEITTNSIPVLFGGVAGQNAPGTTHGYCVETGWAAGPVPGPHQVGTTTPQLPPGETTALLSADANTAPPVFEYGAYVTLVQPKPVAHHMTVTLGEASTKTITLTTTAGTPTYPVTSCAVSTVTGATFTVTTVNVVGVCKAKLTDSVHVVEHAHFKFTASNTYITPQTSTAAQVTVTIGTPPVDQPLYQTVTAGQLVLSCNAPTAVGYPKLLCPTLTLPKITLNGLKQTTTIAANTIYVSDNRGTPTVGWNLTTYMVPTTIATQTNSHCATYADFCDSSVTAHVANPDGRIASKYLKISTITCTVHAGNTNPAPAVEAGGTYTATRTLCRATAGTSGGTFMMNAKFTLTIPASTYAGKYYGTVEYLVS